MGSEREEEQLYRDYAETGPVDDPQIWEKYRALRAGLRHLPQEEQIILLELAADLANTQERAAFLAGLKVGRQDR